MAPARAADRAGADAASISARRTTSRRPARCWRHRAALITVNVALSALLLVGSGLLLRSFLRLLRVDTGFAPAQLLTLKSRPTGQATARSPASPQFYESCLRASAALPGVTLRQRVRRSCRLTGQHRSVGHHHRGPHATRIPPRHPMPTVLPCAPTTSRRCDSAAARPPVHRKRRAGAAPVAVVRQDDGG